MGKKHGATNRKAIARASLAAKLLGDRSDAKGKKSELSAKFVKRLSVRSDEDEGRRR